MYLPGEPNSIRNWKFTDADNGDVVHLNRGEYEMDSVSSQTIIEDDVITQEYEGIVDMGYYLGIGEFTVRISSGKVPFSRMLFYTKSSI